MDSLISDTPHFFVLQRTKTGGHLDLLGEMAGSGRYDPVKKPFPFSIRGENGFAIRSNKPCPLWFGLIINRLSIGIHPIGLCVMNRSRDSHQEI
jgi:hypothetical protein